ncbi:MAG TPA: phosphate ABC transporter permease subunit PstC [Thermoplasmata archaeon]|nr:phosphate ABC transporter permease subunit PstC [Thermoplasmata archaeon]
MESTTPSPPSSPEAPKPRPVSRWPDRIFVGFVGIVGAGVLALALAIVAILVYSARSSFNRFGLAFLWGSTWNPQTEVFGVLPFVAGTLITSAIALLVAVPLALGSAIFITTQAPRFLRGPVGTAIELLAAVPSVIYGLWGIYVIHPLMESTVEPWLKQYLGWTGLFSGPAIGLDVLTAGLILAVMIVPTICAVSRDTLLAVPESQREAALSLGATSWETTRVSMLPYARSGIVGGVILGLGRALGETMAVTMVIGNIDKVPTSLLSPGQTIASLIANELLSSISSLQVAAILECGLVLLAISLLVNVAARVLVWRVSGGRVVGVGVL